MNIKEIQKLTFNEALALANETTEIKGYQVLFVDCGDYFGFSALVFKNGKHIYYANDYELYHRYLTCESGKEALKEYYVKSLNENLFTDSELMGDVTDYNDFTRKDYFLRNYWIMQYNYKSAFGIGEKAKKEIEEAQKIYPFYNPISFCYVSDKTIIDKQINIFNHLDKAYEQIKDNDKIFTQMISYELANHEAGYTGSYEETLNTLGLNFDELTEAQKNIVIQELNKQIGKAYWNKQETSHMLEI